MKNLGVTVGVIKKETENSGSNSTIGKISLTDATSQVFTNQNEAISYINQFTDATLTEVSFDAVTKTLYFTVPADTLLDLAQGFCGKLTNAERLQFSDVNGLIISYEAQAFEGNECNNTFGSNIFFKEASFNEAFGINTFDRDNEFAENCFANYTGTAIFNSHNNFGNLSFYQASGTVKMNYFNTIGNGSFQEFNGFFKINYQNTIGNNCFLSSIVEVKIGTENTIGEQCFFTSNVYGKFGNQNIIGANCFQDVVNNFSVNQKLKFGDNNTFNAYNFSGASEIYLEFGSSNTFLDNCFQFCFDSYLQFSTNNVFKTLCFYATNNIVAKFDYNNTFENNCFSNSTNSEITINKLVSLDDFAENSTSNFTILGEANFGNNCFNGANPTKKNTVEWIENCGTGFALNYTGRFDLLSKLGTTPLQDLPNDFFTTSNLVSIHFPNSLEYNNAGSRDLDLFNMVKNTTNNLNYYSQYLNTTGLISKDNGNTTVTGTTLETIASIVEIPANSLDDLCDIFLSYDYGKNTAITIPIKVYLNTSATTAGAQQIALYNTSSNRNGGFFRKFKLRGAVLDLLSTSTSSLVSNHPGDNTFAPTETKAFNRSVKNYFIITVQNDNNATVWTNKSTTVEKLKI